VVALVTGENVHLKSGTAIHRTPEHYGGAGGELLVLAMIISWILTFIFDPETVKKNPLKDRVGYNNLCVGWDEPPARYVAAPIFALVVYFNVRFMYLDLARAQLSNTSYPEASEHHRTKQHINYVWASNFLNCASFCLCSLIFVIRPKHIHDDPKFDYPLWHTVAFIQLVVCQYIAYAVNLWNTPNSTHIDGCWIFLAIFGIICAGFATCGLTQMITYDHETKTPGPVPWWLTACFDYGWFAGMALQGHFRPRAPSIAVSMVLCSDDDFKMPDNTASYTTIGSSS